MGAFAAFLKRRGIEVTGSDQNVYPPMSDILKEAGVQLFSGYHAENLTKLPARPDLVVIGNVIQATNPEARAAMDGGYSYSSLPEAMERFILPNTRNFVVAGTHGKTTTSSLMAYVATRAGRDPGYFIGGVTHDLPYSFHVPAQIHKGGLFVLEGDEYDTAFWDKVPKFNHYLPNDVVLTSVEYDHADIYPDFAAVMRAFEGLLKRIRPGGRLIACTDCASVRKLLESAPKPKDLEILTYGSERGKDVRFTCEEIRSEGEWTRFKIFEKGELRDELLLRIPGKHNALNALAVWIGTRQLGFDPKTVRSAMMDFRGVKRRQEVRGEVRGVLVMDDFAHHPTAVRETLRALRLKYPERRLVVIFEPRSATSRRKVFQKEYADAFGEAEVIFIASPYDQSKIAPADQFSSDQLVADLKNAGRNARLFSDVGEGVLQVAREARKGDLVAVLSNGGFGGFIPKLITELGNSAGLSTGG